MSGKGLILILVLLGAMLYQVEAGEFLVISSHADAQDLSVTPKYHNKNSYQLI